MSEFTLYSIGIILTHHDRATEYDAFVEETVGTGAVHRVRLGPAGLGELVDAIGRWGLDFDDAYQYVAAREADLSLVSFDSDFDETPEGRLTPLQALEEIG